MYSIGSCEFFITDIRPFQSSTNFDPEKAAAFALGLRRLGRPGLAAHALWAALHAKIGEKERMELLIHYLYNVNRFGLERETARWMKGDVPAKVRELERVLGSRSPQVW